MSRTRKGSKSPGYEYWSRRVGMIWSPSKWAKQMTNRMERVANRITKHIVLSQLDEDEVSEGNYIDYWKRYRNEIY